MWKYTQKIWQSKRPEWSISCPWPLQAECPSSHTHTSPATVCLSCCSFLFSHLQAAQRAAHVLRKWHFWKPFSWAVCFKSSLLTFKFILGANEFSIACLHSAEPLEGRSDWKDNDQGLSPPRNSSKTQAGTREVVEERHKSLLFMPIAISAPTPTSLIASFPDYRNSFFCCWNVWRRAICICKLTNEQWTSCTVP